MRTFYLFKIKTNYSILTKNNPYNLYKTLEEIYHLKKDEIKIAYETIEDISIGVYSAIGTDSRKEYQLFDLGALLLVGINESSSLILGVGAHSIDYKYNGGSFRLGVLTPRNVYLMLDATYNYYVRKDYYLPRNSTTIFSRAIA